MLRLNLEAREAVRGRSVSELPLTFKVKSNSLRSPPSPQPFPAVVKGVRLELYPLERRLVTRG